MDGTVTELEEEKLFYERFNALHRDPALLRICERFGIRVFRRSCVLEGFDEFLQAQNFSGERCIEIGTCKGLTALVLARYFKEVVSIDVVPDPERAIIAEFAEVRNVTFLTVALEEAKAAVIKGLKFDAAFMDGDHGRRTLSDYDMVKSCRRVLFHEYWRAQPSVWDLVNQLRASGGVVTKGKFALWTV